MVVVGYTAHHYQTDRTTPGATAPAGVGAVHAGGHGIDAGRIPRGAQNGREHA